MDLKLAAGARRMTDSMHIAISRYLAAGGDVKGVSSHGINDILKHLLTLSSGKVSFERSHFRSTYEILRMRDAGKDIFLTFLMFVSSSDPAFEGLDLYDRARKLRDMGAAQHESDLWWEHRALESAVVFYMREKGLNNDNYYWDGE